MKVTTMACIQGAWLPNFTPQHILDIGAGTGLLSLMAAQKYSCEIDSVEIESDAYNQLKENIALSPWSKRIHCFYNDIKNHVEHAGKKYDFIISNPPFYAKQLKSTDDKVNHARHEAGLTIEELIDIIARLISQTGKISILLPPAETNKLAKLCVSKSLFISHQLVISYSPKKQPKAIVTILSRKHSTVEKENIFIKNDGGAFTSEIISLLEAYYLSL
jgi:tRNA1Val (adenine37-N6)-methyltransferase